MNYNGVRICMEALELWFDVEIEWITTNTGTPRRYWNTDCGVVVWCRNRMNYNPRTGAGYIPGVVVWCRNRMNYNSSTSFALFRIVVVWCRNRMNYNYYLQTIKILMVVVWCRNRMNYNFFIIHVVLITLWFDVEIEWITTLTAIIEYGLCCGLM